MRQQTGHRPGPTTADASGRQPDGYRQDLDGLRGLAIGLVAVFHIWFGRVSGGVDVFLALSGFFFGGKVLRAALPPGVSLSAAAEVIRLVRRLLPALVVVLTAAGILTILIQPKTRWETFADQSLASLGYFQNRHLADTASQYLRAGEAVSPLQHIWSMSVQGQFYIVFLALIILAAFMFRHKTTRNLRIALTALMPVLMVASFVFAIIAHRADQTSAYYNSFARAWELLAGVLAGALIPHVCWARWLRTLVATAALAAILSCGLLIDGVQEFPGPWALVPVAATVALVLAAANRQADPRTTRWLPWPNRLLASGPLVALGAMAYSLYLWHWPLLIFWLSYSDRPQAGALDGAALLLISGVLAYLTTRFVENPLRSGATTGSPRLIDLATVWGRMRRPTIALGSVVALLAVMLTATSFTWLEHVSLARASGKELAGLSVRDYPGARALLQQIRVPQLPMRPTVLEAKTDLPQTTTSGCISDFGNAELINCTYGDLSATRTVALAGGSHAEHWITALDQLGLAHGFKVITYLKMGCPLSTEPVPMIAGSLTPYQQCYDWVQQVMARLVVDRPDYVFTTTTRPRRGATGDVMPDSYLGIWDELSRNNIGVLGMRDTPWLVRNGRPLEPTDCLASGGDSVSCGMKRSEVLDDRNPTLDYLQQFPLLKPLDMTDAVCRPDACRAVEGNVLIYHDSHHLSASYVRTMTDELGRQVGAATEWW